MEELPVVLGTGISGLAISRHLSNQDIPHILIGPPPHSFPRLGESLDYTATIELDRHFSDLSEYFYSKTSVDFFTNFYHHHCSTVISKYFPFVPSFFWKLIGLAAPAEFYHIDRIKFENELFAKETKRQTCKYINDIILSAEYNDSQDRIALLKCKSGQDIIPAYVFDSSGIQGPVLKSVPNSCELLSDLQITAFGHFSSDDGFCNSEKWQNATGVFQLYDESDGIDAIGWIINCGEILSVGVSTQDRSKEFSAQDLFEKASAHLVKRGFILENCQKRVEPKLFRHRYYKMRKVFGRNWLLAGGSAAGYWFPTGSGVGIGLLAASLAPSILLDYKVAAKYERYVDKLRTSHNSIGKVRDAKCTGSFEFENSLLKSVLNGNILRSAEYYLALGGKTNYFILKAILKFSQRNLLFNRVCRLVKPLKIQK